MPQDSPSTAGIVKACFPSDADGEPSWAHVSGWAQLSGERQSVSCAVTTHDQATELARLLPELSDVLTECGYPWEVIVVDSGSTDRSESLLRSWCEIPGFRSLMLARDFGKETAITAGLEASRGDVVVLLDLPLRHPLELLPGMIMQWESGTEVVYAARDLRDGTSVLKQWNPLTEPETDEASDHANLSDGSCGLLLMDRRVVAMLLA